MQETSLAHDDDLTCSLTSFARGCYIFTNRTHVFGLACFSLSQKIPVPRFLLMLLATDYYGVWFLLLLNVLEDFTTHYWVGWLWPFSL